MTTFGIDRIGFYTPHFCVSLAHLAEWRGVSSGKFLVGLGQEMMSVLPPDEDIVTMAAAAIDDLQLDSLDTVDWLIIATESGIDQSKCAALYVHRLLNMPSTTRAIEMKQACYAGTAALDFALAYVKTHPGRTVLVVNTDVARYGLQSKGESSQGAAAVALLISGTPSIVAIHDHVGVHTQDAMDFWRPNYRTEALVDGQYSCQIYLSSLEKSYQAYLSNQGLPLQFLKACCYHTPFPKLVVKAQNLLKERFDAEHLGSVDESLRYGRLVGNCYTGSLFLALISFLDHAPDYSGHNLGFYSYGSGSIAQFFSGRLQQGYKKALRPLVHHRMIADRVLLSLEHYESFYRFQMPDDGRTCVIPSYTGNRYRLAGIKDHQRLYEVYPLEASCPNPAASEAALS